VQRTTISLDDDLLQFVDRISQRRGLCQIPAGTAIRFEPGETKTVTPIEIAAPEMARYACPSRPLWIFGWFGPTD